MSDFENIMKQNYLEYASYVNMDRSIPKMEDGLKPVQRRILYSMFKTDDGKYTKIANVAGNTMLLHPHGSSDSAIVALGEKDLLIDKQGNWGNGFTGDGAAATRYIEGRLTKFAKEVVFNNSTTKFMRSYDDRREDPIALPVKFPLLLAQGTVGIGVGFATKILPHNPKELLEASILFLQGKEYEIYPDFFTGGYVDVTNYQKGSNKGKVRVRAKIEITGKNEVTITELPFEMTTVSLIDSIIKAYEKNKIKYKKIEDRSAATAQILIHLFPETSKEDFINSLYIFTDCEHSISINCNVIHGGRPTYVDSHQILEYSANHTKDLLKWELENSKAEISRKIRNLFLDYIFISKDVYKVLSNESITSKEIAQEQVSAKMEYNISKKVEAEFKKYLAYIGEITLEDINRLIEMPIRKISTYEIDSVISTLSGLDKEIDSLNVDIENILKYTINYYKSLIKKYFNDCVRKTEITTFQSVSANAVVLTNQKLFANKVEGFIGLGIKKDQHLFDVSDIDDILCISKNGEAQVKKVSDKAFYFKDIETVKRYSKEDESVFTLVYREKDSDISYIKRCKIGGVTRDKIYNLVPENSEVIFFSEGDEVGEELKIEMVPLKRKANILDYNTNMVNITGRNSQGKILLRNKIKTIIKSTRR